MDEVREGVKGMGSGGRVYLQGAGRVYVDGAEMVYRQGLEVDMHGGKL